MSIRFLVSIGVSALVLAVTGPLVGKMASGSGVRTLENHELWDLRGGDPFLCCAFMPECFGDNNCMDKDGAIVLCRAYRDEDEQGGNIDSCTQSPNETDDCQNSLQTQVCLRSQACMVVFDAGVPICVNEENAPWMDVQDVTVFCNGPACT